MTGIPPAWLMPRSAWVPASAGPATADGGLTAPPQAFSLSARPAARMLRAALTSRSCTAPQAARPRRGQTAVSGRRFSRTQSRSGTSARTGRSGGTSGRTAPLSRRPGAAAAPSRRRARTWPAACGPARIRRGLRRRPLGCRGPAAELPCARDRAASRRTLRCRTATRRRALARFAEPFRLRDSARCARARWRSFARRNRGLAMISPSEVTASRSSPTSMPTSRALGGSGAAWRSTTNEA